MNREGLPLVHLLPAVYVVVARDDARAIRKCDASS